MVMCAFLTSLGPRLWPTSNVRTKSFPHPLVPAATSSAALSSEGVVSVFDPVQRKLLRTMGGGDAGFNLAFSGNGKRVAMASGDFASVWDLTTGRRLLNATHAASSETLTQQRWIINAAISSDGEFLAYAARGDNLARVWGLETGRQILELKHNSAVAAVSFNADGTELGTGSYDGTARVWELPSGRELERVSHAGGAEVVAFSLSGGRLPLVAWTVRFPSPRPAAQTGPPSSICPPPYRALPSALMAGASLWARCQRTSSPW
jgi:WD40 repeat protein